jgi:hypothetical protein
VRSTIDVAQRIRTRQGIEILHQILFNLEKTAPETSKILYKDLCEDTMCTAQTYEQDARVKSG